MPQLFNNLSLSLRSFIVTSFIAVGLIVFLWHFVSNENADWIPQTVVALTALVGASWFAGYRLDLFSKDIDQRHVSAENQLNATDRTIFNSAVEKAVEMLSKQNEVSVLSGQRWLHSLADIGEREAELVQTVLCYYVTKTHVSDAGADITDQIVRLRQSALDLLFSSLNSNRFIRCSSKPDLSSTDFDRIKFINFDLRKTVFTGSNFTNSEIMGSCFDGCDFQETEWNSMVGHNPQTSMRKSNFGGANFSSLTFFNIDFTGADFRSHNNRTLFRHCIFRSCDFTQSKWIEAKFESCEFYKCIFSGTDWTDTIINSPKFEECKDLTIELCSSAKLSNPTGLPQSVLDELNKKRLLNIPPS